MAPEGVVHIDSRCHCLLAPDYVVQFGDHSYNPTNEGAGVPATWHWDNLQPSPSTPFKRIIHTGTRPMEGSTGAVTFNAPAPPTS
jgi:hypothetical protein